MNMEILVADVNTFSVYDFLKDGETEEQLLARANKRREEDILHYAELIVEQPEREEFWLGYLKRETKKKYEVMTWDNFRARQKLHLLGDDVKEITEEWYEEMLNVLPPLHYAWINGVEEFCNSEMWTGIYTTQYAKYKGKYYSKMVDSADRSTWLHNILTEEK